MNAVVNDATHMLPTAEAVREQLALAEAERATEARRREAVSAAEKKALIERLSEPSAVSDEEALKRVHAIIRNAVRNELLQVQVHRFPCAQCTDRGRAINRQESGWENTLTGVPKEIFGFWKRRLQPLGYRIHAEVAENTGDIGLTLKWG